MTIPIFAAASRCIIILLQSGAETAIWEHSRSV